MNRTYIDQYAVWHPYSSVVDPTPILKVVHASGTRLTLDSGASLIDAMSSWWSVIHGYNHPEMNAAAEKQLHEFSHVMFGGLTHEPAEALCAELARLTPGNLNTVFLCDTGSVAVEVSLKMAAQYWLGLGHRNKKQFMSFRGGYHGDTRSAMSVSDPETGMHEMFNGIIREQIFLDRPPAGFDRELDPKYIEKLENDIRTHASKCAAVVVEPVVQGAGGMYFYSPKYLTRLAELCKEHELLLIVDEIAMGFGRAGKFFATEYAQIEPDILCLGKALTGGYLTQAATICTPAVAEGICESEARVFMHGPTFMANPLACSISLASIALLLRSDWEKNIQRIERLLSKGLKPAANHENVADVRVLGAIGVIETRRAIDMRKINEVLIEHGVWLRPFGKLIYTMPPFISSDEDIDAITKAMAALVEIVPR